MESVVSALGPFTKTTPQVWVVAINHPDRRSRLVLFQEIGVNVTLVFKAAPLNSGCAPFSSALHMFS